MPLPQVALADFVTTLEQDEAWLRRHRLPPSVVVWADPAPAPAAGGGGGAAAARGGAGGVEGLGSSGALSDPRLPEPSDPRLPELVEYRVQRKRLWKLATQVLEAHAARHRRLQRAS